MSQDNLSERSAAKLEDLINRSLRRLEREVENREGKHRVPLTELAEHYGLNASAISRLRRNSDIPKTEDALLRTLNPLLLTENEKRAALVCWSTLRACSQGQHEIAELYFRMLDGPDFSEGQSGLLMSPKTLEATVGKALQGLGVKHGVSAESISEIARLLAASPGEHALGCLQILRQTDPEVFEDLLDRHRLRDIADAFEQHTHLVTVDTKRDSFVNREVPPGCSIKPKSGRKEVWSVDFIPNVGVFFFDLAPNVLVRDRPRRSTEFLLLTRGSGTFTLEGADPIEMSVDGISLAAHRADKNHHFRSGDRGASIFVFVYERRDSRESKTAVDDVIERMLSMTAEDVRKRTNIRTRDEK